MSESNALVEMSREDQITVIRSFGNEFREAGFELAREQDVEQDHYEKLMSYSRMAIYWQVAEACDTLSASLGAVSNLRELEHEFYKDQAPAVWTTEVTVHPCQWCNGVLRVVPHWQEKEYLEVGAEKGVLPCTCEKPWLGMSVVEQFASTKPF